MSGGWEYIAAAWLITFLAIGAYAYRLHRSLSGAGRDQEEGR